MSIKKNRPTLVLINFKVTPAEHQELVRRAERETRGNVSEYLRQNALKDFKRRKAA